MIGAIIGDIVGSIYELEEINALKFNSNKKRPYEERIKILEANTPLFFNKCSYTDDTTLTIAIANALIENDTFEKSLRKYGLEELSLGKDMYGRNRFGKGFVSWLHNEKIGDSYGNGASMRISPVAYFFDDLDIILRKTKEATIPSHNNEEAIKGAQIVTTAIYLSKQKYSKEQIKEELETRFEMSFEFKLEQLQKNYRFTSRTIDSVPQAIFCFLESNSFEDCLRKSISIGGDSDTIAAIACSIAESFYGVPKELKQRVLAYLPEHYKNTINKFYSILHLKEELKTLQICDENFWEYMTTRTKRINAPLEINIWGTFVDYDNNKKIKEIKILAPEIINQETLLINIHEYAHAFELYQELGKIYNINEKNSENFAKSKEKEYLNKKRY